MSKYLKSGALAGLAGGGALAVVLRLVGEGPIGQAVAIEHARHRGAPMAEMFSRGTQRIGGMAGALVYGLALGAVFGIVFAALRHRLPGRDDWYRAVSFGGIACVTIFLVPFLKYPANPPAVGDPETIGRRTALYVVMVVWSLVATFAAARANRWLRTRAVPDRRRLPAVAGVHVALVAIAFVVLPGNPDAITAPATLVWHFRMASLAGSAALWATMGTVFGWLRIRDRDRGLVPSTG